MYRSLQAGRAAAALLVCVFHTLGCVSNIKYFNIPWAMAPISWGVLAVEYFFALSGFILFTVHHVDLFRSDRFVPYAVKRIVRIYPTYILIALGVLIPALSLSTLRDTVPHKPLVIISQLLLIPRGLQDVPADGSAVAILAVAWTLEYEVFLYVLFGLMLLGRTWASLLMLVLAWAFCSRLVGWPLPRIGMLLASSETVTFVAGMAAAAIHRSGFRVPRPGWVSLGSVVLLFVVHGEFVRPLLSNDTLRGAITSLCAGSLILGLIAGEERGQPVGGHRWIQLLGSASYALYLIHFPLISLMTKAAVAAGIPRLGLLGAAATVLFEVALCIAIALGFHVWVEIPLLAFFRARTRFLTERTTAVAPGNQARLRDP